MHDALRKVEPPMQLPPLAWVPDYAWINTEPLKLGAWRGSPILVEVWNIQCPHCLRSLPWLGAMHARYGPQGVKFLGIHTPEHPEDHDAKRVHEAVARLDVRTPVVMDNQYDYWRALGNRYWPTFYFVDRLGLIRYQHVGGVTPGSAEAQVAEDRLRELLSD